MPLRTAQVVAFSIIRRRSPAAQSASNWRSAAARRSSQAARRACSAVSYTHLTLPTICSV
eukprot:9547575-Alexandrium_andersonii.AAC.1